MIQLDDMMPDGGKYCRMLSLFGSLSRLFSESDIPFIHYRITENLFCRYLNAANLSRTDTAYDARLGTIGVGIKTFTLAGGSSVEKIAEFNKLSPVLKELDGLDLAMRLADFRNERMEIANRIYGITDSVYHIIGRQSGRLDIFNSEYDFVDKDNLHVIKSDKRTLRFSDNRHEYTFNRSKTVLMKRFVLPGDALELPVEIIEDPFVLMENLLRDYVEPDGHNVRPYILLPLFSVKSNTPYVPTKSGLNQWNAAGRRRHENEVYIPIPGVVRKKYPEFFPGKDVPFVLHLPDGSEMSAKVCQEGEKALMSNPNKDLGEWILRKVLHKNPGELVTMTDLEVAGFNSLKVTKDEDGSYDLDVSSDESFEY